jgi:uncharacterized protein (TIGR00288 family)
VTQPLSRPGRHLTHHPLAHAPNAALLIDFDNVTLGIRSDLAKELKHLLNSDIIKGKVAVQRAYADWRRYPQYIVPLSESSIDLIFAPGVGSTKKNATDIRLAIDAIELVFTRPEIGTFILLSGDSDFSMLVIKLKEYGKYVIGVGIRESASDMLIQNCDEYFSYSDLAGLTKEVDVPSVQRDPWELAREAVAMMARNGDVMRSDRLKQVMQQLDPNFDERNAGPRFSRFSKFVVEAGQRGLLQVHKLENGQYEVAPASGAAAPAVSAPAPAAAEAPEPTEGGRRGRGRRGGRGRDRDRDRERPAAVQQAPRGADARRDGQLSLARAFQLMADALGQLKPPVGAESLRLRMQAMHGREDALLDPQRFSRFLRQANDAEVADVRQIGDGDYEVSSHRLEAAAPPVTRPRAAVVAETETPPLAAVASAAAEPEPENGQRFGIRFRRGSRGGVRRADVPLIGVVSVDVPEPAASTTAADAEVPAAPARRRASSGRKRASRPKTTAKQPAAAAAEPATEPPAAEEATPAAPRRRARPRARRKAE